MSRHRGKASDVNLEYAAHPSRPPSGRSALDEDWPHVRRSRPPLLAPEPVDVSRAIGRPPLEWEAYLIIEARRQERARELGLFAGLIR